MKYQGLRMSRDYYSFFSKTEAFNHYNQLISNFLFQMNNFRVTGSPGLGAVCEVRLTPPLCADDSDPRNNFM